jgi:hypothetical protein
MFRDGRKPKVIQACPDSAMKAYPHVNPYNLSLSLAPIATSSWTLPESFPPFTFLAPFTNGTLRAHHAARISLSRLESPTSLSY